MAEHAISDGEQHRTAVIGSEALPADETTQLRWGAYLIALPGLVFIIHGIGFIYRTDYTASFERGINELAGLTVFTLPATHPKVASYITHVQASFTELMIADGLLAYLEVQFVDSTLTAEEGHNQ